MFDDEHLHPPNRLWYRLAMNLLYAGKNKNVVVTARNNTFTDRSARRKSVMDMSAQSFSSTMVSQKKRTNTMRTTVTKKSDIASGKDIDSKEGSLDGER